MQPCGLTQLGLWLLALCVSKGGNYTPFDTCVVELQMHPDVTLKLIESQVPLNSRAEKRSSYEQQARFSTFRFHFSLPSSRLSVPEPTYCSSLPLPWLLGTVCYPRGPLLFYLLWFFPKTLFTACLVSRTVSTNSYKGACGDPSLGLCHGVCDVRARRPVFTVRQN